MSASTGRPRRAGVDETVLAATLDLLATHGYTGLRINDVADAAGVAKTTIYRRWPSLAHLAVAAVERALGDRTTAPTGDPLADLERLVTTAVAGLAANGASLVAIAQDIHRQADPELRSAYRQRIIDPVREPAITLVQSAIDRGLLSAAAQPADLVDAAIGAVLYRVAVLGEPLDADHVTALAGRLLASWRRDGARDI
ncbi:TetR/AcrR family transcriptional regulator [Cellulomonas sp. NPDC089187]|uniref:TetR/AcrR family transcriptional regulator n=1 Tax=Cellulomonas sp. NPDC089187 TaxID=3154970 RepID=UPI00343B35EC